MAKPKKIVRTIPLSACGLEVRAGGGDDDKKNNRTVDGHPILFGVRSENLVSWSQYREIYEVMEPGCITDELLRNSDVILNAFHDNRIIFGRCNRGKGTLSLSLDKRGVTMSCDMPDTSAANDMLELIHRGDITGMSFAFRADEDDSENGVSYERVEERNEDGKEVWIRHVKKVTGLYDVSIVGSPAYSQTDVTANRELGDEMETHLRELSGSPGNSEDDKPKEMPVTHRAIRAKILERQMELDSMDL